MAIPIPSSGQQYNLLKLNKSVTLRRLWRVCLLRLPPNESFGAETDECGLGPHFQPALASATLGRRSRSTGTRPSLKASTALRLMQLIRSPILLLLTISAGASVFAQNLKRPWLGVVVGVPLTGDFHASSPQILLYTGQVKRSFDFRFVA